MKRLLRNIGFFLLLLGASTFIFPLMNRRSLVIAAFGEHERIAAYVALALGAAVFAFSFRMRNEEKKQTSAGPPPQGPGPAAPA